MMGTDWKRYPPEPGCLTFTSLFMVAVAIVKAVFRR